VEANTRQPPLNPRRGGRYRLSYGYYNDRTENRFSFARIEADAQHYFPMLNERRVIALHALASLSEADAGQEVPFYMQRTLGGPDDLRGFERYRFRDTNLVLLQAEYRFEVFTAVDAAIFFDAGSVAPRREDLRLDDLETDYGIGFRFGSDSGVFARIEGAFGGREGARLVLRWGNVF
jgi:outer membrane protein assembly factor BamA